MSRIAVFPDMQTVREDAALWVARADRGLTDAEQSEFVRWVSHPAHRHAYEELGGILHRMEVLSVLSDVFPRTAPAPARPRWRVPVAVGALAATVAAVGVFVLPGLRDHMVTPLTDRAAVAAAQSWSTAVGELRSVALADGSLLSLNTDTLVEVQFTGGERRLRLRRGEAHFEVAHDAARPFVVAVGSRDVRAIGTAFNIRRRVGDDADVLVTSGTVRVSTATAAGGDTLRAGQLLQLRADGSGGIRNLDATEAEAWLSWRRGVIVFDGQTLAQAVAEFSRYTSRTIRLADPAMGRKRIVGYFPSNDLQTLLQLLQSNFGLQVTETDTEILLAENRQRVPPE